MPAGGAPALQARMSLGLVCSIGVGAALGGRSENEDNYLVCRDGRIAWREGDAERLTRVAVSPGTLVAVADGMGGHEDGEIASASAVQAMSGLYLQAPPEEPEDALRAFLLDAHRRLHVRHAVGGKVKMGTTLTVAWVLGDRLYWAHVGDSRLYHWRRGRITRVTRDHTRAEFARRDLRSEPSHGHNLSQNFIYGSRGLGDDRDVRVDRGLDTGSFSLQEGDRVLLCSDGLSGAVEDAVIAESLRHVPDPASCVNALLERAIASRSDDNITALLMRVDRVHDPRDPDPEDWGEETTLVPI